MLDVLLIQTPPSGPALGVFDEAQYQSEVDQFRFGDELNVFEQRRKRAGGLRGTENVPFHQQSGSVVEQYGQVPVGFVLRRQGAQYGQEVTGRDIESARREKNTERLVKMK